jgi:hypothetical protein
MNTCQWCKKSKDGQCLGVKDSLAVIFICADCLKGNEEFFEVIK